MYIIMAKRHTIKTLYPFSSFDSLSTNVKHATKIYTCSRLIRATTTKQQVFVSMKTTIQSINLLKVYFVNYEFRLKDT